MVLWAAHAHKNEIDWNDLRGKDKQALVFGGGEDPDSAKHICYFYGEAVIHFLWDRPNAAKKGEDELDIPRFSCYSEDRQVSAWCTALHYCAKRHAR